MPLHTPTAETADLSSERTTVLATYSSRRDAEMARDRLDAHDVSAFITADDAGGMHVQMQLTNGVKLIGFQSEAETALSLLDEAGMLPESHAPAAPDRETGMADASLLALGLGFVALGAYLWLGATASPFAAYLFAGPGLAMILTAWLRSRGPAQEGG
jgi:hypothetical protein